MAWIKSIPPKMLHDQYGIYNGQWMSEMDRCWQDFERGYTVCSRMIRTKFGNVEHVTITRSCTDANGEFILNAGGSAPIGWAEKQMIKNELFGENRFAVEVYPKEDRLVDVMDVYHLWVFDKKLNMPFGIHPKEYQKAVNRGASMNAEEIEELKAGYNMLSELSKSEDAALVTLIQHQNI